MLITHISMTLMELMEFPYNEVNVWQKYIFFPKSTVGAMYRIHFFINLGPGPSVQPETPSQCPKLNII